MQGEDLFLTETDIQHMLNGLSQAGLVQKCYELTEYPQVLSLDLSSPQKHRRGKPKSELRKLSECFVTHLGSTNALKKDNLRTRLLRRLKRIIRVTGQKEKERSLSKPQISSALRKHFGVKQTVEVPEVQKAIQRWVDVFYLYRSHILPWGNTKTIPNSDKTVTQQRSKIGLSYSNRYCKHFFSTLGMQELYSAFIDILLSDKTCQERSNTLQVGKHKCDSGLDCDNFWNKLADELKLFAS